MYGFWPKTPQLTKISKKKKIQQHFKILKKNIKEKQNLLRVTKQLMSARDNSGEAEELSIIYLSQTTDVICSRNASFSVLTLQSSLLLMLVLLTYLH